MKSLQNSNSSPRKYRTDALRSKFRELQPEQLAALIRWLDVEKVTYGEISRRLSSQFNVSVSMSAVSRFWQKHMAVNAPAPAEPANLLDVIIQSSRPVRLVVKQKVDGISLIRKR